MKRYLNEVLRPLQSVKINHTMYIVGLIINSIMFPLIQMLLSLVQKNLVNAVEYSDMSLMRYVYILSGAIVIMFLVINPLAIYHQEKGIWRFMKKLREKVSFHTLSLSSKFYDSVHSGDILSCFNNDLDNVSQLYTWTMLRLLLAVFYGVGSTILMFALFWPLTILIIILGFFETLVIGKLSERIRKNTDHIQKALGVSNERFIDIIRGLKVIRMFSISHIIFDKYAKVNSDIRDESMKSSKTSLIINALSDVFEAINLIGLLSLGVILYYNDIVDMGTVMAFLILQDGVSYMYYNIGLFMPVLQKNLSCAQRVFDYLDRAEEHDSSSCIRGQIPDHSGVDISLENISFSYGDGENRCSVLKDLSCVIEAGRIISFKGESGCGKSTLVKLLMGYYKIDSGRILVAGRDYSDMTLDEIRANISYISQNPYMFDASIIENIRYGNTDATNHEVILAAKGAFAHQFITELEESYDTMLHNNGSNLSGGQRQRIALARAILKDAPIFILDEATTAVDSHAESFISETLCALASKGKTVVIIAHRTSSIKVADKVFTIESGRIAT